MDGQGTRGARRAIGDGSDESESTGGSSLDYQKLDGPQCPFSGKITKVIGIAKIAVAPSPVRN